MQGCESATDTAVALFICVREVALTLEQAPWQADDPS